MIMKIAFIGGVRFSHELLSTILSKGWNVSVVFSYKDSKEKYYSDIALFSELTKKYGVRYVQVDNINDPENTKILKEIKPDLILVMGWSQLLKNEIIRIPKLGVIGSHPTELPKYRGRAPLSWSILKNLKESALTFFYIDEGVDNGDILDQKKFNISEEDDATTLYKKIITLGKEMILKNLVLIEDNNVSRKKQMENKFIENWPKRTIKDGEINWNNSSEEIHRLIRATTNPYPGAFTKFKNEKLIIWSSKFVINDDNKPGVLKKIEDDSISIGTGKGTLKILKATYKNKHELGEIFSTNDVGVKLG